MAGAGTDELHVDVMDDRYLWTTLTLDLPVVRALATATRLPLDVHGILSHLGAWGGVYLRLPTPRR